MLIRIPDDIIKNRIFDETERKNKMWNGKMKALTFSYDDAVTTDEHLIDIFNKYGMRATFNINSGTMVHKGQPRITWRARKGYGYLTKFYLEEVAQVYSGHEVASHGFLHRGLDKLCRDECEKELSQDIRTIEKIVGYRPKGMAYANGYYSDTAVEVIRSLGLRYARATKPTYNFDLQNDLLRFRPTLRHRDERLMELAKEFVALKPEEPNLFCVWGHSEEFEHDGNWELIERFCDLLASSGDIFFGTNSEVLLGQ